MLLAYSWYMKVYQLPGISALETESLGAHFPTLSRIMKTFLYSVTYFISLAASHKATHRN